MSFQQQIAKGEAACLKFDFKALEKGYLTCKPVIDIAGYDRIIDIKGKLYRVQIKTTKHSGIETTGSVYVDLRRSRTHKDFRYTHNNIDALVIYVEPIGKFCWFDSEIFEKHHDGFSIRYKEAKNKQKKNCIFAKDYLW